MGHSNARSCCSRSGLSAPFRVWWWQYGIAAFKLQLAPFFYEPAPESPLPYAKLKDYVFIGNFR